MSTLFPEPKPPPPGPCEWCGAPSTQRMEVTPARYSTRTGIRLVSVHAIEADVCARHAEMIERNRAEAEVAAKAEAKARRARRP